MRIKNTILLFMIACIGGIALFLVCKYTYQLKVTELKKEAYNVFIQVLNEELKERKVEGPLIHTISNVASWLGVDLPDSVSIIDSTGKHRYKLDPQKHLKNITDMTDMRLLHSIVFIEDPLIPDSLNSIWRKYLSSSHLPTKSALKISRTNYKGEIDSQTTLDSKWCITSNMVFTFYMGYACEIEMMGYLHYSIWNIMPTMLSIYFLLYIIYVYGSYRFAMFVNRKVVAMRRKEIIEVPVITLVKEASDTPVRSYILHDNIIFYAEQQIIELDGKKEKIQKQQSLLLELFLRNKDEGYVLEDDVISQHLWPDRSGSVDRLHKAIGRLRSKLNELDGSIDIKRQGTNAYQLLL